MVNFSTDIIDNPRYQQYKIIRGVLFIILIIYGTPAYFMSGSSSNRRTISEEMQDHPGLMYYYIGLAIIAGLFGIVHYYSWRTKKIGKLHIDENQIKIEKNGKFFNRNSSEFRKIEFIRNSTFHKEEHIGKPYSGNNWLELHFKEKDIEKYEFLISDEDHNQEFEKIIQVLKSKLGRKFIFKSI